MVVSVDVPTGLGTNLALKPDYTITFHDLKEGMNPDNSGKIKVVDIGIPKEAKEYVGPGELVYYPKPKKDSHKGENGIVLVIGGGPYVGAPTLSGMAALRIGVDLVFIATPKRCWQQISSFSPNLIVKELSSDILKEEDIPLLEGLIDKCTAIIVGPGLGNSEETEEAVKGVMELLAKKRKPLVIDADAIKPVGEELDTIRNSKTVITPHRNEFKKLTGLELSNNMEESVATVSGWAREMGVTLFLKGPIDIISDGKETKLNKIHNEAMTVGGTGDVLSGIIGGLLSKGVKPFNAARMAAFINGEAGNESFRKKSYGLLATDIVEEIPEVLKKYL
jgi:NAD(P)H-hydrate epimerase